MAASIDNQDSTNQIETESEEKAKESVVQFLDRMKKVLDEKS